MDESEPYRVRLQQAGSVVESHFNTSSGVPIEHSDGKKTLTQAELWVEVLSGRPELPVLNAATDELDSGLYNLALGQYRECYGNLRLSMELAFASIYFSSNELALREWLVDKRDIVWSSLIHDEKGTSVLTVPFASAFNEEMGSRWTQFRSLANALHRELSTHVHGNASRRRSSRTLSFDRATALDWLTKCQNAHLAWQYLMLARYTDFLKAKRAELSDPFKAMLRSVFLSIDETKAILADLDCG